MDLIPKLPSDPIPERIIPALYLAYQALRNERIYLSVIATTCFE
jgi:hypothetical protein